MPSFYYRARRYPDYPTLLQAVPESDIPKNTRSTVPLLDYWRATDSRLSGLASVLGVNLAPAELHFEFRVPVGKGKGKDSFTDLMLITSDAAVAIEAKFTEPMYDDVCAWLGIEPTENRRAVLEGWLEMIGGAVGQRLDVEAVTALPYQLIHRTASVCSIHRPARAVVYQLFGDKPVEPYLAMLKSFRQVIGPTSSLRLLAVAVPADFIADPQAKGVRDGLVEGPVFRFWEPKYVEAK